MPARQWARRRSHPGDRLPGPAQSTMGDAQRIVYIHVAVAWVGLARLHRHGRNRTALPAAARAGLGSLGPGAGRSGLVVCRPDARHGFHLGTCRLGNMVDVGATTDNRIHLVVHVLRLSHRAQQHGTRGSSRQVLQPCWRSSVRWMCRLVVMATRLFRGMHPVSPGMEPSMRWVLWLSVVSFTVVLPVAARRATQADWHVAGNCRLGDRAVNGERTMGTFVVTYVIVWTAIAVYVAHLGAHQSKLRRSLDQLREQIARREHTDNGTVRAASGPEEQQESAFAAAIADNSGGNLMPAAMLLLAACVAAAEGVSQDGCVGGVVINSSRDGRAGGRSPCRAGDEVRHSVRVVRRNHDGCGRPIPVPQLAGQSIRSIQGVGAVRRNSLSGTAHPTWPPTAPQPQSPWPCGTWSNSRIRSWCAATTSASSRPPGCWRSPSH